MSLFVYGSLMAPRVLEHVIGRTQQHIERKKAWIDGYHRYCIRDRSYPALCKIDSNGSQDCNGVVEGTLLLGLNETDLTALDNFEGDEYIRTSVLVRIDSGRDAVETFTYIWAKGSSDPQLYSTWSFEEHFLPNQAKCLKEWGFI